MDISRLLNEIKASNRYENQIVHIEEILAREALYVPLKLKTQVKAALLGVGIVDLNPTSLKRQKNPGRKRRRAPHDHSKRKVPHLHGPYF